MKTIKHITDTSAKTQAKKVLNNNRKMTGKATLFWE